MAAIEVNLGLMPDAPQAPNQQPPPPPPLNNPPNPPPQVPNRQPAAVRHADENGNHVQVIPANAPHTRYRPPPTNQHNNTRQQHRSSVTPQSAARPRANTTIRANGRLTFDLTDDDDSDAGDLITQRPAVHQRHLDMIDRVNNGKQFGCQPFSGPQQPWRFHGCDSQNWWRPCKTRSGLGNRR